jgi:SAM-dependent methyltransferase
VAEYTGIDNLEAMSVAKNYNSNIVTFVKKSLGAGELLVDFGCGDGTIACLLIENGYTVIGIETSPILRKVSEEKGIKTFSKIVEIESPWHQMCMINVLEHIEKDTQLLKEIYSGLPSSGRLFIYVPAHKFLFSEMDRHVGHFRRYSKKELIQKASRAGFKVEKAGYIDSLGIIGQLVLKAIGFFKKKNLFSGQLSVAQVSFYDKYIFPISKFADWFTRHLVGKNIYLVAVKVNDNSDLIKSDETS